MKQDLKNIPKCFVSFILEPLERTINKYEKKHKITKKEAKELEKLNKLYYEKLKKLEEIMQDE